MNRVYAVIFLIFISVIPEQLLAQETDNQLWLNYSFKVKTGTKFSYGGDVGGRGLWTNNWNQVFIRPSAGYKFNKISSVALAIALFHTDAKQVSNITEFRIHQDYNIQWLQTKWFSLFARGRLEQRFFSFQNENLSNEFRIRGRLLLGVQSQDLHWFGPRRPIYFQSMYEGFLNFSSDDTELLVNQARFHIALGHRIAENWKYEFHFIIQSSRFSQETGLNVSENIFRLRLFHTLNMNKLKPTIPEIEENRIDDFN